MRKRPGESKSMGSLGMLYLEGVQEQRVGCWDWNGDSQHHRRKCGGQFADGLDPQCLALPCGHTGSET